jgi:hypothetical protein
MGIIPTPNIPEVLLLVAYKAMPFIPFLSFRPFGIGLYGGECGNSDDVMLVGVRKTAGVLKTSEIEEDTRAM